MLARAELAATRLNVLLTAMARRHHRPAGERRHVTRRPGRALQERPVSPMREHGRPVRANLETLRQNIAQGLGSLKADQILGSS